MTETKRITIHDVARDAGVSRQTVSRVINDRPDVASETRARVKEVIAKLGYQPNLIARSMKGRNTYTLGCITPNLIDYNFSRIVEAAQDEARRQNFFILTGSAPTENEVQPLLDEMLNRQVDGFLVLNPRDDDRYKHILSLIERKIPVVYIKNTPNNELVSSVCLDDKLGGYLATQYLLQLGHTSIITILGPKNEECTLERLSGYRQAFAEAGKTPDENWILNGDWSAHSGRDAIRTFLEEKIPFSAIFAQNDRMAVGAIRMAREAGLSVPHDVSVIGYDDIPLTSFFDPPLTTIRQPMDQIGKISAQLLIETVKNINYEPRIVRLEPELIERNTCSPYIS